MPLSPDRIAVRTRQADEHFAAECAGDVDRILRSMGELPVLVLNGTPVAGDAAVRGIYRALVDAFPDFRVELVKRCVSDEAVHDEVILRGTHRGPWAGVAPTSRRIAVPASVVFTFDALDRMTAEKAWFDNALLLSQLGVVAETARS